MSPSRIVGLIGAIILGLGVFCPIMSAPIVGSVNYIGHGQRDGVIILALAVVAFVLVVMDAIEWLWVPGLCSLGLIGFSAFSIYQKISELKVEMAQSLAGNPFAGLAQGFAETLQLQWGVGVLVVGCLLLIASSLMPRSLSVVRMPHTTPRLGTCPHCAERIMQAARVCKHCRRDIAPAGISQ